MCHFSPRNGGDNPRGQGVVASLRSPFPLRFSPPSPRFPDPFSLCAPQTFRNAVNKENAELREVRIRKEGAHVCGANCAVSQCETCARGKTLGRGETGAKRRLPFPCGCPSRIRAPRPAKINDRTPVKEKMTKTICF